jgi:hypothetical protein
VEQDMVTKKQELSKRELLESFETLPDDATVHDFIEHLATVIGLEPRPSEGDAETHDLPERMKKTRLMESLGRLSDDATIDDFVYRLYVILKIENGMAASKAGNKVTQEEARERLKRWLQ